MTKFLKTIEKINTENYELYVKKANLEDKILAIDIKLFKLMGKYNKIVKQIIK